MRAWAARTGCRGHRCARRAAHERAGPGGGLQEWVGIRVFVSGVCVSAACSGSSRCSHGGGALHEQVQRLPMQSGAWSRVPTGGLLYKAFWVHLFVPLLGVFCTLQHCTSGGCRPGGLAARQAPQGFGWAGLGASHRTPSQALGLRVKP